MLGVWEYDFSTSDWAPPAPPPQPFVYYGGFHIFSSAVFVSTSSGTGIASTWQYFGGFHVFSNTPLAQGSTWQYWGGFHIFGSGPATSSGAAAVTAGRRLISPTGFKTAATVVRF